MKLYLKVINIVALIFTLWIIYLGFGILLNSALDMKYEAASISDIKYIYNFSIILIFYSISILIILILNLIFLNRKKTSVTQ